jgi:hypothetical protein
MNRTGWLAIIVALIAIACSNDDDGTAPSSSVPPPSSASTSVATTVETTVVTTSSPTTSTPSTPPTTATTTTPSTTPAEDDWQAIVQTLGRRRDDLYAHPDVSRITDVCAEQSECFEQLQVQLSDLANKGWRVVDSDPYVVLDARLERFDGETLETSLLVTVIALVERPANAGRIVDSDGETVAEVEAETPVGVNTENRTILARTGRPTDPWRLVSQQRIREVPA